MTRIRRRAYKSHQVFSMIMCVLIIVGGIVLSYIPNAFHMQLILGSRKMTAQSLAILLWCGVIFCGEIGYVVYFFYLLQGKDTIESMFRLAYMGILSICTAQVLTSTTEKNQGIYSGLFVVVLLMWAEYIGSRLMEAMVDLKREEQERQLLMNMKNELLEQNYREILELTQKSRKIYHDFKNQINVLVHYAEQGNLEKVKEYLRGIAGPVFILEAHVWTGNEMLDLILNRKLAEALGRGITFTVDAEHVGQLSLNDLQICSVFGNLLDNAIEACEKIEDGEKWIKTELRKKGQMLLLTITNSISRQPRQRGGRFFTGKSRGEIHGLGIDNVRSIVAERGGEMQIDYNDKVFEVNILLFNECLARPEGREYNKD